MSEYNSNISPHRLLEKELKDQELITLHKTVLTQYIMSNLQWKNRKRSRVLKKYDQEINRKNIRCYYNRHVGIFLLALIQDQLHLIKDYAPDLNDEDDEDDEDE